jgi:hypothetical protein
LIWCLLWITLSSNSPESHKFISLDEKNYIIEETKDSVATHNEHGSLKVFASVYLNLNYFKIFLKMRIHHGKKC